jgi:hypothetical protein
MKCAFAARGTLLFGLMGGEVRGPLAAIAASSLSLTRTRASRHCRKRQAFVGRGETDEGERCPAALEGRLVLGDDGWNHPGRP